MGNQPGACAAWRVVTLATAMIFAMELQQIGRIHGA